MNPFPPLTTPPAGLGAISAGWASSRPASGSLSGAHGNAAQAFGFNGDTQAARLLTVPAASGDNAAQLEARFLSHLFQRS